METVLVDTSVWINFFKGIETKESLFLKNNLNSIIIAICPVILQEVMQGIVSERDKRIVDFYFNSLNRLLAEPYSMAVDAAELYRSLRAKGTTVRKPNDCLIASFAIKSKITLLSNDKDFEMIAKNTALRLLGADNH